MEAPFENLHCKEREPGRNQRAASIAYITPINDHRKDRRVGARPANPKVLQRLDQRRIGVPRGRLRFMAFRLDAKFCHQVACCKLRKRGLLLLQLLLLRIRSLHIGQKEPRKQNPLSRSGEAKLSRVGCDFDLDARSGRVGGEHLASERAAIDQLIKVVMLLAESLKGRFQALRASLDGRRANRLVRFLRVCDLRRIAIRFGRKAIVSELPGNLLPNRLDGLLREVQAVGSHVGDQTDPFAPADIDALVQVLGDPHCSVRRPSKLPVGLLLERCGSKRRRGAVLDVLRFDSRDLPSIGAVRRRAKLFAPALVQEHGALRSNGPCGVVEVRARNHRRTVDEAKVGLELDSLGLQPRPQVPILPCLKRPSLLFTIHDELHRRGLDPPRAEVARHFAPQNGRKRVSVQPVENPPSLLSFDELLVDRAGGPKRLQDRILRNFVKGDSHDRNSLPRF
ncbi:MAG: hypothetical protein CNCCGFBP_00752 [Fimbriimonadaceae bacterium]|nr:hypothetical protein [Fimbriimonadaceae bacterium]